MPRIDARVGHVHAEAAGALLTDEEWDELPRGAARIALELCARFLADVVHDRYFRFDEARYPSRPAHNLARARGQLALHRSAAAQAEELSNLCAALRAGLRPRSMLDEP